MFLRYILVISLFLLASSAPIGKKRKSTKVKHTSIKDTRPKNYESLGKSLSFDDDQDEESFVLRRGIRRRYALSGRFQSEISVGR